MDALILINRYLHIVLGFVGLVAWWIPIVTSKGGTTHRRFGKVFVLSAYVIGVTAVVSAPLRAADALLSGMAWPVLAPQLPFLIFLGYLGVLTLNLVHFGMRVLRTRRTPEGLATPVLTGLTWLMMIWSVGAAIYGVVYWSGASIIMLVLAPPGIIQGLEQRRYMAGRRPAISKPWFFAHMDAMLGAGIAFHTAFLVFGSRVVFDLSIMGPFNWVPWVLPAIIGTIGGNAWRKSYMRAFGDLPSREPARV